LHKQLILLFFLHSFNAVQADSEINLSRSKLVQLASHLEVAEPDKQYFFSQIALFEMFDSYQQEIERSYTHPPKTKSRLRDVHRWRFASQSYLKTINQYLYLLDSGSTLRFLVSRQNKIFLIIANTPVIISGPNAGADKQIEKNIVDKFCQQYDCREYFARTYNADLDKAFVHSDISGEWLFNSQDHVSFAVSNGLVFIFSKLSEREKKEQWAIKLCNELSLLLKYLNRTQKRGKSIDWLSLAIMELPLTDNAYKIIINNDNDYLKLTLPLLGKNPALFHILIPWLKQNFENQGNYRMIIKNAERFLSR